MQEDQPQAQRKLEKGAGKTEISLPRGRGHPGGKTEEHVETGLREEHPAADQVFRGLLPEDRGVLGRDGADERVLPLRSQLTAAIEIEIVIN